MTPPAPNERRSRGFPDNADSTRCHHPFHSYLIYRLTINSCIAYKKGENTMRVQQSHSSFGKMRLLLGVALLLCVLSSCTSAEAAGVGTGGQRPAACSA